MESKNEKTTVSGRKVDATGGGVPRTLYIFNDWCYDGKYHVRHGHVARVV